MILSNSVNIASTFGPWQRGRREIVQRVLKKLPLAEVNEAGRTFRVKMQCDAMCRPSESRVELFFQTKCNSRKPRNCQVRQAQREAAFREAQLMRRISRNCTPPQLIYSVKCCNALTRPGHADQFHICTQAHAHTHTQVHTET